MKYLIGSSIISFGLLFVVVIVTMAVGLKAPEDLLTYLGIAWVLLTIALYPVAKKIVRD